MIPSDSISVVPALAAALRAHSREAARSTVPMAVTRDDAHVIHYANDAFCRLFEQSPESLECARFLELCREPVSVRALLDRCYQSRATVLAANVSYLRRRRPLFGTTLVSPLLDDGPAGLVVHVVDTTEQMWTQTRQARTRTELQEANQRLLLAALREQQLAERAKSATQEVQRLLVRAGVLAEASAILSSSLECCESVRKVAQLVVPELADCCVIEVLADVAPPPAIAHVDPRLEAQLRALGRPLRGAQDGASAADEVVRSGAPRVIPELADGGARETQEGELPPALRALGARSCLFVPLRARDEVVGVLALIASESSRRYGRAELEFAEELARRIGMAIASARLYREAQQAVRMRDDVLAIVSHDLQSPLNAIAMTVRRLRHGLEQHDPGEQRSLELIERTVQHMGSLIAELLDFARIHAGQLRLECSAHDLAGLVNEAWLLLGPLAEQKHVRIERRLPGAPLLGACDRERTLRVLLNVLGNAIKYSPQGGEVAISAELRGQEIQVGVQDQGPGVDPGDHARLFEPYWKGGPSGRGGLGLGLYIARGIVQAQGGRIWVESAPGAGSTFSFTLPAHESQSARGLLARN